MKSGKNTFITSIIGSCMLFSASLSFASSEWEKLGISEFQYRHMQIRDKKKLESLHTKTSAQPLSIMKQPSVNSISKISLGSLFPDGVSYIYYTGKTYQTKVRTMTKKERLLSEIASKRASLNKLLGEEILYSVGNSNALFNLMILANAKGLINFKHKTDWDLMVSLAKHTGLNCHQSSILLFLSMNPESFFKVLEHEDEDSINNMYADELKKDSLIYSVKQFKTGDWDSITLDLDDFEAADLIMDHIIRSIVFPKIYKKSGTEDISFILGTSHSFLTMTNPVTSESMVYENHSEGTPIHISSIDDIKSRYENYILNGEATLYAKIWGLYLNAITNQKIKGDVEMLEIENDTNRNILIRDYADRFIDIHLSH